METSSEIKVDDLTIIPIYEGLKLPKPVTTITATTCPITTKEQGVLARPKGAKALPTFQ